MSPPQLSILTTWAKKPSKKQPMLLVLLQCFMLALSLVLGAFETFSDDSYIAFARYGTVITVIDFIVLCRLKGSILNGVVLLFASFVLFSYGVPILSSFDENYSDFYMSCLDKSTLAHFSWYTTLCIQTYCLGLSIAVKKKSKKNKTVQTPDRKKIFSKVKELFRQAFKEHSELIVSSCTAIFILFGIVAFSYIINFAFVSFEHDINIARDLVKNSALDNLARGFFVPSGLMLLAYEWRPQRKAAVITILSVYGLLSCLSGDRTEGLTLLVVVFLFWYTEMNRNGEISSRKKGLAVLLAGILVLSIPIIAITRVNGDLSGISFAGMIGAVFGELGFNFYTACFQSQIFDSLYMGQTYLCSLPTLIPNSIDFLGVSSACEPFTAEVVFNEKMRETYFWATFGLGYSMVAESYLNFGFAGCGVIFIFGWILGKLCTKKPDNPFSVYLSYAVLWAGLTFARRSFIFPLNSLEYILVFVPVVIYILVVLQMRSFYGSRKDG